MGQTITMYNTQITFLNKSLIVKLFFIVFVIELPLVQRHYLSIYTSILPQPRMDTRLQADSAFRARGRGFASTPKFFGRTSWYSTLTLY